MLTSILVLVGLSLAPSSPPPPCAVVELRATPGYAWTARFELNGTVVERDDFNRTAVPYQMVRSAGQRGDCFASEYRLGAQYLLLFTDRPRSRTIQWWPLAPVNEQLRGEDDPWLAWVRAQASSRAGR